MNKILDYLDELFPNPKCELIYNNDYELLISVMLSSQTTDKKVNEVTSVLYNKYKNLDSLSNANIDDIKEIIKPLGNYNKKSLNIIEIAKRISIIGKVPNDREFLESLPGVGRKTTNLVLCMLYHEPYMAVDTHVSRVSKRLGLVDKLDNAEIIEKKLYSLIPKSNISKCHHQIVLFGRYYCKSNKPLCSNCRLNDICKKN